VGVRVSPSALFYDYNLLFLQQVFCAYRQKFYQFHLLHTSVPHILKMGLKNEDQNRRSPSCLVINPYTYCFCMNVPKDLQSYICIKELRYSLKTGGISKSKNKARFTLGQVQRLFKFLRKGAVFSFTLVRAVFKNLWSLVIKIFRGQ
jgi:hypothetical protein